MALCHITCMVIVFTMLSGTCFGQEIDLEKTLFDKGAVATINWETIQNHTIFKETPAKQKTSKTSHMVHANYGTVDLDGIKLDLVLVSDATTSRTVQLLLPLHTYPNGKKNNDESEVIRVGNKLRSIFGTDCTHYRSRTLRYGNSFIENEYCQWTIGKTRVEYATAKVFNNHHIQSQKSAINYGPVTTFKQYVPVAFVTCTYHTKFNETAITKLDDFLLGIDSNTNKIINADYFNLDGFSIDGESITGNFDKNNMTTRMTIKRSNWEISGYVQVNDVNYKLEGTCARTSR